MFYEKWNFSKPKYIHNVAELICKSRMNPDGNYLNWVWKDNKFYYLICAILNNSSDSNSEDIDSYSLTDVIYKIFKLNQIGDDIYQYSSSFIDDEHHALLIENNNFNSFFGITNNHYHPNEIASQYFEYYFYDIINQTQTLRTEGYKLFKNNIKTLI